MAFRNSLRPVLGLALVACAAACGSDDESATCAEVAASATRSCVAEVNAAWQACYRAGGCSSTEPDVEAAVRRLESSLAGACAPGEFGALDPGAVAGRLANACRSETDTLRWRSFGGPQESVLSAADADTRSCLVDAYGAAATLIDDSLSAIDGCLQSGSCDAAALGSQRDALAQSAQDAIGQACADGVFDVLPTPPAIFVERAAHQADCIAATAHADTGSLLLSCGPSNAEFDPPRGEYVSVRVDGEKWGTQCADGTPYEFHVRLAPEGHPLDRIVIGLQGGGVCVFAEDCAAKLERSPGLFTAMDDEPRISGIASNDPDESAFAHWTKVFLPYCNQDVFAGGGSVEDLGDGVSVPRFGSVNLRAAVRMVRDVIWKRMDAAGGAGFRPDTLVALFGGWSAGGYGTLYNYHWLLDDLQWPHTAAFPDASLALDNGEVLGVRGLGGIKIPAWGMGPNLPPYCFLGNCALGPVIYEAISPRLQTVPEQQMLVLTNPRDLIQQGDAFFGGEEEEAQWINAIRQSYCDTRDLPGIHYYMTSVSDESIHVISLRPTLWNGSVAGETLRDWFQRAIEEPATLEDRVEEGNFVQDIPGVEPFPCALGE